MNSIFRKNFGSKEFQNSTNLLLNVILLFVLTFVSCTNIKPVHISGISNFKSINTLSDPELKFDLNVENPNTFGVTVTRMKLDLFNVDTKIVAVSLDSKTKISRNQAVSVPVSMKPSIDAISALLKSEMSNLVRGKVNQKLELRGELVMRKFIFKRRVKIKEAVKL